MSIIDYFGKDVVVKTDDGQVFIGHVTSIETIADSDDGVASIDVDGTKQFPNDSVNLRDDEIIDIKEQTSN
ncbi:hypothetical protein [Companilactobacillus hulinensis]|uniref:hypothetical protein n=1 Tax=Companilactobacillus hulinensis TaxID=2486007 RepID=UPI000F7AC18B|nr:hypothetical protein [Companilactobacillus hulinensis]